MAATDSYQRLEELEVLLAGVTPAECAWPEPASPIWLTGVDTPAARAHCAEHRDLGIMLQPGNSTHLRADQYAWVGIDNGCFSTTNSFDMDAWLRWIESLAANEAIVQRALFATAPDVVGDAAATLKRSRRPLEVIRKLGLPAAFVAQDGLTVDMCRWDDFDALFIGGSTDWKLSPVAFELAARARELGKWVHYGRVNSWKRWRTVLAGHADSADGTFLGFGPEANWPRVAGWMAEMRSGAAQVAGVPVAPPDPTYVHPPSVFDYGAAGLPPKALAR